MYIIDSTVNMHRVHDVHYDCCSSVTFCKAYSRMIRNTDRIRGK